MADIVEIVQKFTLQVDDQQATQGFQRQIGKIDELNNKVKQLDAQLKATAKGDLANRERINQEIAETVGLLDQENEKLGEQYINNTKLQQVVARQIGTINELNNRYQTLSKLKAAAFTTADISKYNTELQKVNRQLLQVSSSGLNKVQGGFNGIQFTLGNIIRDTPSFAFGLQAGIIAISNNIGPAFDAIRDKVAALRAEGKPTAGVFREIGSALFSVTGLLNLAVLAFSLFGAEMLAGGESAKQAAKYLTDLKNASKEAGAQAAQDTAKLRILRGIIDDTTQSTENRTRAVETLKKLMPDIFSQYRTEAFLLGEVASAYDQAAAAILRKARANAAEKKLQVALEREDELNTQLFERRVALGGALRTENSNAYTADGIPIQDNREPRLNYLRGQVQETKQQIERVQQFQKQLVDEVVKNTDLPDPTPPGRIPKGRKERENKLKQIDKEAKDTYVGTLRLIDQQLAQNKILSEDLKFLNEQEVDINSQFLNQEISLEERDKVLEEIGLKKDLVVRKLNFDALNQKVQLADQFGNTLDKAKFTQELQGAFQELQDVTIQLTVKYAIRSSDGLAPDQVKQDIDKQANGPDEQFKDQDALIARQNRKENFLKIISEYENLANAIANALNTIYDAQIRAADRDIALREKRVDKAQKIAEKGNVDILREEERALNESIRIREQAARRQAAVNAALALSNSIVAIARAAAEGGGYASIATVAAVIGALAAGYSFVKSLDNTPAFKDGVVDLQGKGTSRSDSIHARLSKGESVITAEATQKYKPMLEAMNAGRSLMPLLPVMIKSDSKELGGLKTELSLLRQDVQNIRFSAVNSVDKSGVHQMVTTTARQTRRSFL